MFGSAFLISRALGFSKAGVVAPVKEM